VRRSVFPYKVGHPDVPSTRAVGGLGQIRSGFAANWSMGLSRARGAWTASGRVSLPGTPSPASIPGDNLAAASRGDARVANWSMGLPRTRGARTAVIHNPTTSPAVGSHRRLLRPKASGQLASGVGRREGGRDPGTRPGVPSQSPLQPPGAAGPVSGGGV
jgi:hypothetical protein